MAEKRSAWWYVLFGCLFLGAILVVGVIALGMWGFRAAKNFEAELKDPASRTEKVQRILGADELPDGYYAGLGMSIPLVMDTAILTSNPESEGAFQGEFGERGMIYFKSLGFGQNEQELRDYFEGKTDDASILSQNNINVDIDEVLGRGIIPAAERTLMYVVQRGSVNTQGMSGKGITAVVLVDCPGDSKTRVAIWFGPDPDPNSTAEDLDLTGTPGDEVEIASFMGHFRFCQ